MKKKIRKLMVLFLVLTMCINGTVQGAAVSDGRTKSQTEEFTQSSFEEGKDTERSDRVTELETEKPESEKPAEPSKEPETGKPAEPSKEPETGKPADTEKEPETGKPAEPSKEPETGKPAEPSKESETGKPANRIEESQAGKPLETETKASETDVKEETEKQTEAEAAEKATLRLEVLGSAAVDVYYGVDSLEQVLARQGKSDCFTKTFEVERKLLRNGKLWVYAQAAGNTVYRGMKEPEGVTHQVLKSMEGQRGFMFLQFDVSKQSGQQNTPIVLDFSGIESTRLTRAAADAFKTGQTVLYTPTGTDAIRWVGGQPSMYVPSPVTGESSIWGNGTWSVSRPSMDSLFSMFNVQKPTPSPRYTGVGTDGGNNVYLRCTGITNTSWHDGMKDEQVAIRCIEVDTDGLSTTVTFRLWVTKGFRGQTAEGYMQITYAEESNKDVIFRKTLRSEGIQDILGNTKDTADLGGTIFRLYKVSANGIQGLENKWGLGDLSNYNTKEKKKEVLAKIQEMFLAGNAKPGETEANPNPDRFKYLGKYVTIGNGCTDRIPIDSGAKDYYVVFEKKSPDGLNMGYTGNSGVPAGSHYFYKIFTTYGTDNNLVTLNANGVYSKDTDTVAIVEIGDQPVLRTGKVKKVIQGADPSTNGFSWKDFGVQISDTPSFNGKVKSIPLTGPVTEFGGLFEGTVYYIREDPGSKACTDDMGYICHTQIYSFFVSKDGKVIYSDTNPADVTAQNAVDAYAHEAIGTEITSLSYTGVNEQGIPNQPCRGVGQLYKSSVLPDISDENCYYSLENAVYKIYRKKSPTAEPRDGEEVAELRTGKDGKSHLLELPVGYYYAMEVQAPHGFRLNEDVYEFELKRGITQPVEVKDVPENDPMGILVQKKDSETGKDSPQAASALEGAQYSVKLYMGFYDTEEEMKDLEPIRSWVYETDEKGRIDLSYFDPVSGDPVYYDTSYITHTLPKGTIVIQEVKAPDGYQLDPNVYVYNMGNRLDGVVYSENAVEVEEEPVRGDLRFLKTSDSGTPMAGIPFSITSKTTGESHVMLTDEKGILDTSVKHSANTNRGENAEDGIWFGEMEKLDDEKGALLYDTYVVEELECEGNADKFLMEPFEVTIEENQTVLEWDPIVNEQKKVPKIRTMATEQESQKAYAYVKETTIIKDRIELADLELGKTYRITGYLVEQSTGKPILDAAGKKITASTEFTAGQEQQGFEPVLEQGEDPRYTGGLVELEYTLDSRMLKGRSVVVFEELYLGTYLAATHKDLKDKDQTIQFCDPQLSTTATEKNSGKHFAKREKEVTIIDQVTYQNLIAGESYRISGILMDQATGQPLLVDGVSVTAEQTFTAEQEEGQVNVSFTLNAETLEEVSTVVFETLFYQEREIAAHQELQDLKQTVCFTDAELKTTARDEKTKDHTGIPRKKTVLTDRVDYTGLVAGKTYTIKGILMDKKTGNPLKSNGKTVESSQTFTTEQREGTQDISFTFDSSSLDGKEVVVFETLYKGEQELAVHADLEDREQTVVFRKPETESEETEETNQETETDTKKEKPSPKKESSDSSAPKTKDSAPTTVFLAMFFIASIILSGYILKKSKLRK